MFLQLFGSNNKRQQLNFIDRWCTFSRQNWNCLLLHIWDELQCFDELSKMKHNYTKYHENAVNFDVKLSNKLKIVCGNAEHTNLILLKC